MNHLWNADGTPKLPDTVRRADGAPFLDLAQAEEKQAYLNYAAMRSETLTNQPAGVGDVVHFWDGDACVAAMVTEAGLFDGEGDYLAIFQPRQVPGYTALAILHDEVKVLGTWHWPESQ